MVIGRIQPVIGSGQHGPVQLLDLGRIGPQGLESVFPVQFHELARGIDRFAAQTVLFVKVHLFETGLQRCGRFGQGRFCR